MKNRESGFTLFELIVVMAIFTIVIVGVSQMFIAILSDFKQQSKITLTNIEGILGLEIMRRDIENAGYGLPWSWGAPMNYEEEQAASIYKDAPSNLPRALVSGDGTGWNGTDRLVIKAVNVANNTTVDRWNFLYTSPAGSTNVWTPLNENLGYAATSPYVIVLSQDATTRTLVPVGAGFSTRFSDVASFSTTRSDPSIVYGLDPNTEPKMPFNRADYYVQEPASASDLPRYCAQGTGILYKAVIDQTKNSAGFLADQPILDCVADMQVAYFYIDSGGNLQKNEDIHTLTAAEVRNFVREVRVYILAQEGQRDNNYTYPTNPVLVGETGGVFGTVGRSFDFQSNSIPDWKNYRWKLYTIVVRPSNI